MLHGLAAALAVATADRFAYDPSRPLAVRTVATRAGGERDVVFDGGASGPVGATVIRAAGGQRGPAVVWVHWLGEPATTNRTEFLADARALAARGVTSILVDAMWSRDRWFERGRTPAHDDADATAQVVALRRAVDLIAAEPQVDPQRIALVGHDFGAMYGALAAAADPRIRYAVLMTPALTFWEWFLFGPAPADVPAYVEKISALDLARWLPRAHLDAALFQFGERDPYVATTTAAAAKRLVPGRATVKTYASGHDLALAAAGNDRRAWLEARLLREP